MVLGKPPGPGHENFEAARRELLNTVALMSEVPVVRRWPPMPHFASDACMPKTASASPALDLPRSHAGDIALVAVGASTGGPLALKAFFATLRPGFEAPVVVVQHISLGFADGMVQWLTRATGYPVKVAADDDRLEAGVAYVAPDGAHMQVKAQGRVVLSDDAPVNGFRPSVARLCDSVARAYGLRAAG